MDATQLVLQIQQAADPAEAKRLTNDLLQVLQPFLRVVSNRFSPTARGSLSVEDLMQVGGMEALKLVPKYDHARRGSQTFEDLLFRRAVRACMDQVRMHASDVHVSDGAARNRGVKKVGLAVVVNSRDNVDTVHRLDKRGMADFSNVPSSFEGSSIRSGQEEAAETPESLLSEQQEAQLMRAAVYRLPAAQREIVCEVYGIGRPTASLREVARKLDVNRARLAGLLEEAQAALKAEIERERAVLVGRVSIAYRRNRRR